MKKLVIFDFDGTLTRKDSMLELTRYHCGFFRFSIGMLFLSPVLVLYKLKLYPNWKAKQHFLTIFFGGMDLEKFNAICEDFSKERLPGLIRPLALKKLEEYKAKGDQMVIVSASAENWLNSWGKENDLPVIATRLEVQKGSITGKLKGRNCHGPEKVKRLKEQFNLQHFTEIIVYGDSEGDKELFDVATEHHFKPFR